MELWALVGAILIIALCCALFEIPDRFQKLLYILCAVLVVIFVAGYFFGFPSHNIAIR